MRADELLRIYSNDVYLIRNLLITKTVLTTVDVAQQLETASTNGRAGDILHILHTVISTSLLSPHAYA